MNNTSIVAVTDTDADVTLRTHTVADVIVLVVGELHCAIRTSPFVHALVIALTLYPLGIVIEIFTDFAESAGTDTDAEVNVFDLNTFVSNRSSS